MLELNVAATLKIMPSDIDVDLNSINDKISKIVEKFGRVNNFEIKPIAFGLKSLEVVILLNDSTGGIDKIESEIKKISGVSEIEVTDVTRI